MVLGRSDVFPAMGGSIGYDYMYMNFYNPTTLRELTSDGTHFKRNPLPLVGGLNQTQFHQMEFVAQTMRKIVIGHWRFKQKIR